MRGLEFAVVFLHFSLFTLDFLLDFRNLCHFTCNLSCYFSILWHKLSNNTAISELWWCCHKLSHHLTICYPSVWSGPGYIPYINDACRLPKYRGARLFKHARLFGVIMVITSQEWLFWLKMYSLLFNLCVLDFTWIIIWSENQHSYSWFHLCWASRFGPIPLLDGCGIKYARAFIPVFTVTVLLTDDIFLQHKYL